MATLGEQRDGARAQERRLEQWLRRHAKDEERRIVRLRSIESWHELAALRDPLPQDSKLREALTASLDRIRESKAMAPEFEAERLFKEALVDLRKEPRLGRGLLLELSVGDLLETVYARRAHQHLIAQYDR